MTYKVAIIIINWNSYEITNDCLHSLKNISYPDADVIVVDNGSEDNSGSKLKSEHPHITLISSDTNRGFTGGNNLGMKHALENDYQFVLMLNNDTFVEPDFLEPLVSYLITNPDAGAIQPRIFFNHDRSLIWNAGTSFNSFWGYTSTKGYNKPSKKSDEHIREVDWLTGCAMLIRSDVLRQTGLLAENLFIYYEDVDLSFRIKKLGYKLIYHPLSVIYHIAGMSHKKVVKGKDGFLNPFVHYLNVRNSIWFLKKYTPWYYVPGVLSYNLLRNTGIITYFALRLRFNKMRSVIRGIKDGLSQSIS